MRLASRVLTQSRAAQPASRSRPEGARSYARDKVEVTAKQIAAAAAAFQTALDEIAKAAAVPVAAPTTGCRSESSNRHCRT